LEIEMPKHTEKDRVKTAKKLGTGLAGRAGVSLATRRSRIEAALEQAGASKRKKKK
jgi:hypothetical protein